VWFGAMDARVASALWLWPALVLYLGVLRHVDALGQISSNKSAAQGLIAQTDNALIQCCVSESGCCCCCCCCWLVYKSYGAGLIWRSIRCKSTHKLLGDVFAFDIAAEYRNISIRPLLDHSPSASTLGGYVYPSGTFRCNHSANRGESGQARQAGRQAAATGCDI